MQDEVRERNEFASRYGKMRRRISTGRSRRGGLSAIGCRLYELSDELSEVWSRPTGCWVELLGQIRLFWVEYLKVRNHIVAAA